MQKWRSAKNKSKRFRNRGRAVRLEPGRFTIDVGFMTELLNGAHTYNAAEADAWIVWREPQHRKWAPGQVLPTLPSGHPPGPTIGRGRVMRGGS
jgi:hypothetical protein